MRADHLLGEGDVLNSSADDGEIRVNIGDSITGKGWAMGAPVWHSFGFVSRPNDPDVDGAAQVLYEVDGNDKRVLCGRDNRYVDRVGELGKGDSAVICDGEARIFVKQSSDSVVLYTVAGPSGKGMMVELNGNAGTLKLLNGGAWIELKDDKITLGAGSGAAVVTIDADGVQIDGKLFACNTGGGNLGVVASSPLGSVAPAPPAMSILMGPTGMAGIGAKSWTVSPL